MNKISIKHINNLHNDWLRTLDFYGGELGVLRNRLTEVAGKNSDKEMLAEVEHYENQFKLKKENVDILSHNIRENLAQIASQAEGAHAGFVDAKLQENHTELGVQVTTEEKLINELRHNFNSFASKWM